MAAPDAPAQPGSQQRSQPSRREEPTTPWGAFPPAGHRTAYRRATEHRQPYFVDRFSLGMLVVVLMLAVASIVDAILTIQLLQAGADEINPLMDHLLDYGVLPFFFGKYLLTVTGLPLLLIFKNHYMFGTPIRVGYLIPVLVALYVVLIGYQLFLTHQYGVF